MKRQHSTGSKASKKSDSDAGKTVKGAVKAEEKKKAKVVEEEKKGEPVADKPVQAMNK